MKRRSAAVVFARIFREASERSPTECIPVRLRSHVWAQAAELMDRQGRPSHRKATP